MDTFFCKIISPSLVLCLWLKRRLNLERINQLLYKLGELCCSLRLTNLYVKKYKIYFVARVLVQIIVGYRKKNTWINKKSLTA